MNFSLADIATLVNGNVLGDQHIQIQALSPIDDIKAGTLVFAQGKDNMKLAEQSEAAAILVGNAVTSEHKSVIQVSNPLKAFILLLQHFYPSKNNSASIHPTAVIDETVHIGKNVYIGPYVVIESATTIADNCVLKSHIHIGHNVHIGEHTTLHPQVTVYDNCVIGARVSIHASTVVGSDGFGYHYADGEHLKMPHVGNVIIEDDVEIGANTAIDRATLGSTRIGEGTKIDNLVQIAHSVKLGKHNIICAFTGIAGSTTSGNNVVFAANVGVSDHVRIDDGVVLAARTGVPPHKHLLTGNVYLGNPARPKDKAIEHELSVTRIPFMRKNIRSLNDKIAELSAKIAANEAK